MEAEMAGRDFGAVCLRAKWWVCVEVVTVTADNSGR